MGGDESDGIVVSCEASGFGVAGRGGTGVKAACAGSCCRRGKSSDGCAGTGAAVSCDTEQRRESVLHILVCLKKQRGAGTG